MVFYTLVARENDSNSSKAPLHPFGRIMRLGIMRYRGSVKVCVWVGLIARYTNFELGRGAMTAWGCVRLIWPARLKSKSHMQDLDSCLPVLGEGKIVTFHCIFAVVKGQLFHYRGCCQSTETGKPLV